MEDKINFLASLEKLKIARNNGKTINVSALEKEFLSFTSHINKPSLRVKLPNLYIPHNEEVKHLEEIVAHFDLNQTYQNGIDISGGYDITQLRHMIFLSLRQSEADHSTSLRSYLNPLIQIVYNELGFLIEEFSVNEAIGGKIEVKRGSVNLDEISIFPQRFQKGPYLLSVSLDTPNTSVEKFKAFYDKLAEIKKNPKKFLSDPNVINVSKEGAELRKIMGSLSRYSYPNKIETSINVNSYVSRNETRTYFYLYNPNTNENVMVYFNEEPFKIGEEPKELVVLEGKNYQHSLHKLVEMGFYAPSEAILENRIKRLSQIYDDAKRHGNNMEIKHVALSETMDKLENLSEYFASVRNEEMRKKHVLRQMPELLELVVYPTLNDPILHELLPRLSWNEGLRAYHHTRQFIRLYEGAFNEDKEKMIKAITPSIIFNNQQNNDINSWLYLNHKEFCEANGINFELIK